MRNVPPISELRDKYENKDAKGPILRACDFVAVYAGRIFLHLPFTPNQITAIWIIVKIIGASLLATGDYTLSIMGMLLFYLGSIIDGADGIVARARKHFSLNGIYVDYAGHYLTNSLILVTLAIGVFVRAGTASVFIPAAIGVFAFLISKASSINPIWYKHPEQRTRVEQLIYGKKIALKSQKNKAMAILFDVIRLENPFNVFFWGVVLGYPVFTLWIYAVSNSLEMVRKIFMQFYRIHKSEKNRPATES